jgi:hypothetical protein
MLIALRFRCGAFWMSGAIASRICPKILPTASAGFTFHCAIIPWLDPIQLLQDRIRVEARSIQRNDVEQRLDQALHERVRFLRHEAGEQNEEEVVGDGIERRSARESVSSGDRDATHAGTYSQTASTRSMLTASCFFPVDSIKNRAMSLTLLS